MQASAHLQVAQEFLAASESYSVSAAPLIRSEMLWCAAAHSVKAAANEGHLRAGRVIRSEATVRRFVSRMAVILRDHPQLP